jgi:hypothetical protein
MACCAGNECPMHVPEAGQHGPAHAGQADADRCCAASERNDPASPSGPATVAPGIVPDAVSVPLPEPVQGDAWRASLPAPAARVAKHLLLSVFLV